MALHVATNSPSASLFVNSMQFSCDASLAHERGEARERDAEGPTSRSDDSSNHSDYPCEQRQRHRSLIIDGQKVLLRGEDAEDEACADNEVSSADVARRSSPMFPCWTDSCDVELNHFTDCPTETVYDTPPVPRQVAQLRSFESEPRPSTAGLNRSFEVSATGLSPSAQPPSLESMVCSSSSTLPPQSPPPPLPPKVSMRSLLSTSLPSRQHERPVTGSKWPEVAFSRQHQSESSSRVHVIEAALPPRRERYDVFSRLSPLETTVDDGGASRHEFSLVVTRSRRAKASAASSLSALDAEDRYGEKASCGFKRLRKRVLRALRLSKRNRMPSHVAVSRPSSGVLLADAVQGAQAAHKPPLLPRQNSSPLGLLPAPPRPKTLKPPKTPSAPSSCCSTSTGTPSSPPTPSLHRATPLVEKNYDTLSLNSLVNRPLPPVPTAENVYADVHFRDEVPMPHALSVYPWFHDVEREDVDRILRDVGEQGSFLVRISRRGGPTNPFTLSLLHEGRIFHLNIRKRPDGSFALGSAKTREKTFATVSELIEHHRQEEILLTSRNQPAGSTRLTTTYHVGSQQAVD